MEGWVDLGALITPRSGIEPTTARSEAQGGFVWFDRTPLDRQQYIYTCNCCGPSCKLPNISVKIQLNLHQMSHFKWKSPKIFWWGAVPSREEIPPPQTPSLSAPTAPRPLTPTAPRSNPPQECVAKGLPNALTSAPPKHPIVYRVRTPGYLPSILPQTTQEQSRCRWDVMKLACSVETAWRQTILGIREVHCRLQQ